MKLHENIKAARLHLGLTQMELALAVGTNQTIICSYEAGKRIPSKNVLDRLAEELKTDIWELTGDDEATLGQSRLMESVKGLSTADLNILFDYVEFLKYKRDKKLP